MVLRGHVDAIGWGASIPSRGLPVGARLTLWFSCPARATTTGVPQEERRPDPAGGNDDRGPASRSSCRHPGHSPTLCRQRIHPIDSRHTRLRGRGPAVARSDGTRGPAARRRALRATRAPLSTPRTGAGPLRLLLSPRRRSRRRRREQLRIEAVPARHAHHRRHRVGDRPPPAPVGERRACSAVGGWPRRRDRACRGRRHRTHRRAHRLGPRHEAPTQHPHLPPGRPSRRSHPQRQRQLHLPTPQGPTHT